MGREELGGNAGKSNRNLKGSMGKRKGSDRKKNSLQTSNQNQSPVVSLSGKIGIGKERQASVLQITLTSLIMAAPLWNHLLHSVEYERPKFWDPTRPSRSSCCHDTAYCNSSSILRAEKSHRFLTGASGNTNSRCLRGRYKRCVLLCAADECT